MYLKMISLRITCCKGTQRAWLLETLHSVPKQARWLGGSGGHMPYLDSALPLHNAQYSRGISLTAKSGDAAIIQTSKVHPLAPACAGTHPLSCILKVFHSE